MRVPDSIELVVSHAGRRIAFEPIRNLLRHVARRERSQIKALSIVFADHRTVGDLNKRYLQRQRNTDVIAFDLREAEQRGSIDGEIYVDLDTAAERASEFHARYTDEVHRYAVHGLLHLIGYRDETEAGKREMRNLEDRYLEEWKTRYG